MVDEARRILGNVGQVSQLGRSFSWSTTPSATRRNLEVVVTMRGGRTRIRIQENLAPLVGAIYGGIGGGMGGGGMGPIMGVMFGALHFPFAAVALVIPAWLSTTYLTARIAYRTTTKRRRAELEDLANRLAQVAHELIDEGQRPALGATDWKRLR